MSQISELSEKVARLDVVISDMHARLFGNGQPGIITNQEERIRVLESLAIKIGVIYGILIALIEVLPKLPIRAMLGW